MVGSSGDGASDSKEGDGDRGAGDGVASDGEEVGDVSGDGLSGAGDAVAESDVGGRSESGWGAGRPLQNPPCRALVGNVSLGDRIDQGPHDGNRMWKP